MVVVGVPLGSQPLSGAWVCEGTVEMGKKHVFVQLICACFESLKHFNIISDLNYVVFCFWHEHFFIFLAIIAVWLR